VNLNAVVGPIVAAVNPVSLISIRISTEQGATQPNGTRPPAYATPGALTGSIAGTVLTVSALTAGTLQIGQSLVGASPLLPGTELTGQLSGAAGGLGTYSVSRSQTVPPQAMSTAFVVPAQVQPLSTRDLRQIEGLNLQGTLKAVYINARLDGVVRPLLKGADLVTLADGTVWLVSTVTEPWTMTAGWVKAVIILQNGG